MILIHFHTLAGDFPDRAWSVDLGPTRLDNLICAARGQDEEAQHGRRRTFGFRKPDYEFSSLGIRQRRMMADNPFWAFREFLA